MRRVSVRLATPLLSFALTVSFAFSQQETRSRVLQAVDESKRITLRGNTHPLAQAQYDSGIASPDLPMDRMLLVLKQSQEQQRALIRLLDEQHDIASPVYHKWLTPDEFGRRFGPSDADIETIKAWLLSQGFRIGQVARGRTAIEFSGTAGQVERAFHTTIHKYTVGGEDHWANSGDMQIPAALSPVVAGVFTLHNFRKKPMIHIGERAPVKFERGHAPQVTFPSPTTHALGPADFAKIYNIDPVYTAGVDGTGVVIGVVGRSEIDLSDVVDFQSAFSLSGQIPTVVNNGPSPGNLGGGEEFEAVLDATWSHAIAPGATVKFVVSATTNTTDGVDLSELYIVDNNAADVMTESFGACEAAFTSAEVTEISQLAQQAAAQGITYMVSTGDTGAPGCDNLGETVASGPISVNLLASTPFNVAVGGTMFNEASQDAKYWSNAGPLAATALSYIPENVWNESCTTASCGASANIAAGGGGTSAIFAKPAWQSGVSGIPATAFRHLPDVSLTAAGHDPYLLCVQRSCAADFIWFISGTSASAPSFAGVMALVNQKMGGRQGQANYALYKLAASQTYSQCNGSKTTALPAATCIFNDVTVGNNAVPGEAGYGTSSAKYQSGVAFDLATGLGSVNVANLVNKWNTATFRASATTLALTPTSFKHGAPVQVNITVAPGSGTGVPSGDVSLLNGDQPLSGAGGQVFTLTGGAVNNTTNVLSGGNYHVVAHYAGDGTFAPSDSAPVAVTITPENSTTTLSIFGFGPAGLIPFTTGVYGDPAYMRADVAGASGRGTATGNVAFTDGGAGNVLGNFALNAAGNTETAQGYFTLPVGSHSVVARYAGDSSFNASNSTPVVVTITKAPTTLSLTAGSTSVGSGQAVTLNATVRTNSAGRGTGGTLTFLSNGTPISTAGNPVAVNPIDGFGSVQSGEFLPAGGVASLTTVLPDGQNSITAQYNGDGNYTGVTSTPITINVAADFDVTLSSPTMTLTQGAAGTVTVSIVGQAAYAGTVDFSGASCTGLPSKSTCSFNPASVTGSGDSTLTIKTTAPGAASMAGMTWTTGIGFAFASILMIGAGGKPRYRRVAAGFVVCASLLAIGACGGGSSTPPPNPGTPKGTFTVTVKATSGTLSHSKPLTLTVQ